MTPSPNLSDMKFVFVVGSVRSGTSIVGQALNKVLGGDRGYFEGNVTGMIAVLSDAIDTYYGNPNAKFLLPTAGNHLSKLPREWVKASLQQFVLSQVAKPAIACGPGVWVDKSPDGSAQAHKLRSCSVLAKVFPNAKFVFCRRHGLENVASRMRKWGEPTFVNDCHGWAGVMKTWVKLRPELAGRYVEVDQYMISADANKVADDLALTLSMTLAERDAVRDFLEGENREQTDNNPARPPRGLRDIDWSLMQKWIFLALCGPMMTRFNYDLGDLPAAHAQAPTLTLDHAAIETETFNMDDASRESIDLPGGFYLTAAAKGAPEPMVRFRSVPAWAKTRLRGALVHGSSKGTGIVYTIRIREACSGREVLGRKYTVAPGEAHELDDPFHSSADFVDVEVSTSTPPYGMVRRVMEGPSRSPAFARARIVGLSCTPEFLA